MNDTPPTYEELLEGLDSLKRQNYQIMRYLRHIVKENSSHYQDLLTLLLDQNSLKRNKDIELITKAPLAINSLDHLDPLGTKQDNTRSEAFYGRCLSLFGEDLSLLDLGCAGGGLVFEFAIKGKLAIGLEGSDYSQQTKRANWRTLPENLFVCDITKPFLLQNRKTKERTNFTVISCWEVLEHIPEKDLPQLFENVRLHLKENGLFVGSVSKIKEDPHHITIHENDWWRDLYQKHGLDVSIGYEHEFSFNEFCRGIDGGLYDSHNYLRNPEKGFHFIARKRSETCT